MFDSSFENHAITDTDNFMNWNPVKRIWCTYNDTWSLITNRHEAIDKSPTNIRAEMQEGCINKSQWALQQIIERKISGVIHHLSIF